MSKKYSAKSFNRDTKEVVKIFESDDLMEILQLIEEEKTGERQKFYEMGCMIIIYDKQIIIDMVRKS